MRSIRMMVVAAGLVTLTACGDTGAGESTTTTTARTTTTTTTPTTTTAAPTTTEATTTTVAGTAPPPAVTGLTVVPGEADGEVLVTFDPSPDPEVGAYMILYWETPDDERMVGFPVFPDDTIGDKLGYVDPNSHEFVEGGPCYVVVAQKPNPDEDGILFSPESEQVCIDLDG